MAEHSTIKNIEIIKGKWKTASKKSILAKQLYKKNVTVRPEIELHHLIKTEQMRRELDHPELKRPTQEDIILECVRKELGGKRGIQGMGQKGNENG